MPARDGQHMPVPRCAASAQLEVGVLMDLAAYTHSHLQSAAALIGQAEASGLSLPQLREALQAHLLDQMQASKRVEPAIMQPSCPRCGAPLEMQALCPKVSPHWRTAIACTSDSCAYHSLSTHTAGHLLRNGLASQVEER